MTAADRPAPRVGDELPSLAVPCVRAEDITTMALLLRDPNPIHFDLHAVAAAGLGDRVINQGGATIAYVFNFLAQWAGSYSAVRRLDCSFRGNVAAGDDVEVGGRVTEIEPTEAGWLVGVDVWADVVDGRRAVLGSASVTWDGERA